LVEAKLVKLGTSYNQEVISWRYQCPGRFPGPSWTGFLPKATVPGAL